MEIKKGREGLQQKLDYFEEWAKKGDQSAEIDYTYYKFLIEGMDSLKEGECSKNLSSQKNGTRVSYGTLVTLKEKDCYISSTYAIAGNIGDKQLEPIADIYDIVKLNKNNEYEIIHVSFDTSKPGMVRITTGIGTDDAKTRTFDYTKDLSVEDSHLLLDVSSYMLRISDKVSEAWRVSPKTRELHWGPITVYQTPDEEIENE